MLYDVKQDSICPHCGRRNDRHSAEQDITPAPGDISLCIQCGQFAKFDDHLKLRPFTDTEKLAIVQDPEVLTEMQRIKAAWLMAQAHINMHKN